MPVEDEHVRPRRAWYAVTVVLWAVALTLFVIALVAIAHVVNSGVDQVRNHATVGIDSDGVTVYATDTDADCTLVSDTGRGSALEPMDVTLRIDAGGRSYRAIGVTPESLPAGRYDLDCVGAPPATVYGTGPRVDVTALATRALWGIFLPLALGVIGLVVLIVVVVKRRGAKSRVRGGRVDSPSGYSGGWDRTDRPPSGPPPPPPPRT
jgi:uncharacterized membrane protein